MSGLLAFGEAMAMVARPGDDMRVATIRAAALTLSVGADVPDKPVGGYALAIQTLRELADQIETELRS